MTAYEPGTVAVATVRGVKGVRVFLTMSRGDEGNLWRHLEVKGRWASHDRDVTDVRPLVVLDLDAYGAKELADYLSGVDRHLSFGDRLSIAREVRGQIKPPRIPEPGPWGVVRARLTSTPGATVWTAVRLDDGDWRVDDGGTFAWDDLIDPTLIREGLS